MNPENAIGNPLWDAVGPFLARAGLGGLLGLAVGYTVKKGLKLAAIVIAVLFIGSQFLVWKGYIGSIDWSAINVDFLSHLDKGFLDAVWSFFTQNLPFGGGFAAGFALGFIKG